MLINVYRCFEVQFLVTLVTDSHGNFYSGINLGKLICGERLYLFVCLFADNEDMRKNSMVTMSTNVYRWF